jgi:hypothetical protein
MNRRMFLSALSGSLVAVPLAAQPQEARKVVRIGLLSLAASDPASASRWKAFRDRLGEPGYVEGQNTTFESRWADGQVGRLRGLAAELIASKVDILVTAGSRNCGPTPLQLASHRHGDGR